MRRHLGLTFEGEYEISDLGRSLAPLFAHLADWASTNLDTVERARHHYDAKAAR